MGMCRLAPLAAAAIVIWTGLASAKTLVFCSEGNPESLNPQTMTTTTGINAGRPFFNNLVEFAPGTTEIVPDVNADPRYLACFASTKSEIVVPIFDGGEVVGEIDVDGSDHDAFDDMDARFLEEVAALVAPLRPRS